MRKSGALLVTIFLFLCFWGSSGFCASNPPQPDQVKLKADYGGLPLSFIKNQGQVDKEVLFYLKGREGTIYFTKSGIVYDLVKKEGKSQAQGAGSQEGASSQETDVGTQQAAPENQEPTVGAQNIAPNDQASDNQTFSRLSFTLKPQGANPDVQVIPQDELPGKINCFIGNDRQSWHTNIPIYKSVIYQGIYPGIDLKVYGTNRQMEYDFIVHPGADPKNISLAGEGIDGLEVDQGGNLLIKTALTDIKHLKPIIYQEVDGKRLIVEGSFTTAQNRIGFDIKNYNTNYPLTIDPLTLSYSTYLGGSGDDYGRGIAVDSQGCAYVTGYTASSDFPTANAFDSSYNTNTDVFVVKLTAAGNTLAYATYLGGSNLDYGYGIAVDSEGCAYITGATASSNFPTANAYQGTIAGGAYDAFVTKLTASGNVLVYSTYLGGSSSTDYAYGIAVDTAGFAYVTGYTSSVNFPTVNPYQATRAGGWEIFVTKFTASGNALSYSTYLGGTVNDFGYGIAVDSSGCAYVTGYTGSTNFPTANPYQATFKGNNDVIVTKFTAEGNALVYSTYLGGVSNEYGYGIAVDNSGCAYVTGVTASSNFPTANAFDSSYNNYNDAFVTKFTAGGSVLAYSTYLGGSYTDYGQAIAVDTEGCAYVTGYTSSSNFPCVNPYQATMNGQDAFVTKFTAAGDALVYSTYLGGSSVEYGYSIAVDTTGCPYVTGYTTSTNFPTVNPYQGSRSGSKDAFVSKLIFCLVPVADFSANSTSGYAPLTVAFTDQSTNSPTSWSWDFGDEGTSDLQNPSHQYTTPGTYTVSLTATNTCGNDTETKTGYITVNVCPQTVANFSATQSAPLTVAFTDSSTNNPTTWSWDFGDSGTSDLQNPTHEYTTPNTYTVTLTAGNVCSSDSKTSQITVVPLSIDITSPQNGESFLASPITVTGTVTCPATQVTVNGISATVNGTNFTAEDVPLVTGPNTITAIATYEGSNAQDVISVTLLVPQGPIQYFYDDLGRLTKAQDEEGNVIEYTYDSNGNRQTKTITVP